MSEALYLSMASSFLLVSPLAEVKTQVLRQPSPLMSGRMQHVTTRATKDGRQQVDRTAVPPRGAFSAQMLRPPNSPAFSMDNLLRPEDDASFSSVMYAVVSPRKKSGNQALSPPPPPPPYPPGGCRRPKTTRSITTKSSSIEDHIKGQETLDQQQDGEEPEKLNAVMLTPSVHPIDTLSKKLRQQAMELTKVYEELEKQNLQIDAYKQQMKEQKLQLEKLRTQQRKSIDNESGMSTTSRSGALGQQKRAAQMMTGTPSTGASLGQKRGELDRKLKEAEQEKKRYQLAAKRIEKALVELQVFQNDRMQTFASGSFNKEDDTTSGGLETVLSEQCAYIRVLEEAVHLKATEFEITGHEELLVVLAELRHTIYEQEKDVEKKSKALESTQEQLEQESQRHEVTKELVTSFQREKENDSRRLHEQESGLHVQLEQMQAQLQQRELQILQFQGVSTDTQRKEEALQSRLEAATKSQNLMEAKLQDATRSVRSLQGQVNVLSSQCEEAKQQTKRLEEECSKKQSHLDEMNALQEELFSSVDEYAAKANKAHEKVERLEDEVQAHQQKEALARKQADDAAQSSDERISALRTQIDEGERREQQLQTQYTALQQEKIRLENTLAEMQQNLDEQIREGNSQQQEASAKEDKLQLMEENVAELESALATSLCMIAEEQGKIWEDDRSDVDELAFLLDPSVLRELRTFCQALNTLASDGASVLCPSFPDIIARIIAMGDRVQTEITRALASWARERSNLVETCATLDCTAQMCQDEMMKRHGDVLDYRSRLMERTSEVEVFSMQVDTLDEQLRSAEAELETFHALQQHASNQDAVIEAKQALIRELSAENDRLAQVERAYVVQVSTNARQSQRLEDQQQAMKEQKTYSDDLERALENAATFAEQQNECNQHLTQKLSEVEVARREQVDLVKTLEEQSLVISKRFVDLVKQYVSFLQPIAATDRELRDSLKLFEMEVQNGDTLALLQLFPALVEEYVATCGGEMSKKAKEPKQWRKPAIETRQQLQAPLSPTTKDQKPKLTMVKEEFQLAEQLELIRGAFQGYRKL